MDTTELRELLAKRGHGHVTKRADGVLARCGGPRMCSHCALEEAVAALLSELDEVRADMTQSHLECERMVAQVHEFRLRALSAESERDALRAAVERVRGCQRYDIGPERYWDGHLDNEPDPEGDFMLASDVLGALGQGEG